MKRVAIYIRVSTDEQAKNGWSLQGQYDEIRAFCDKQIGDWKVVKIFRDDGYSAGDLNRPGMQNLLACAQDRLIDIVVVWKYDRLSRDNVDFPVILHFFDKHGIQVISINEPSPEYNSPYGEFVVGMIGLMATLERRMIQMRAKMGLRTRAKKGLWHGGPTPYGYSYDKNSGKLIINDEEMSIVRKIYELYLEHKSLYAVRKAMKMLGMKTRRGRFWHVIEIRNVLTRAIYTGKIKCSGIEVIDESIRAISPALFEQVGELLKKEKAVISLDGSIEPRQMKHQWLGKGENPPCPQCRMRQTVRKRGLKRLANGQVNRKYYCNKCDRWFIPETADREIPLCPICFDSQAVQYFNTWSTSGVVSFSTYRCWRCGKNFRTINEPCLNETILAEPLRSTTVGTVCASTK